MARNVKNRLFSFVLALIVLLMGAIVYYQFDESLNPGAMAVLNHSPSDIKPQDNAYYHLLGLYAKQGSVPFKKGLEIVEHAKAKYLKDNNIALLTDSEIENAHEINRLAETNAVCDFKEIPCLKELLSVKDDFLALRADNSTLLNRLREIYQLDQFQETPYLMSFDHVMVIHRLALTDVAFKWAQGDKSTALELLNQDLKFWRSVSEGEISLITKMIASALIGRDLQLLSEFISDCNACAEIVLKVTSFNMPLSPAELSFRSAIGNEFRYAFASMHSEVEAEVKESLDAKMLYRILYKPNSLLNKIYRDHAAIINQSECEVSAYFACLDTYNKVRYQEIRFLSLEFFNDPLGSILANIAKPDYEIYLRRVYTQEAYRQLIRVKYDLLDKKIKHDAIQGYLKALPIESKLSFDGTKLLWLADKKQLGIFLQADNSLIVKISL